MELKIKRRISPYAMPLLTALYLCCLGCVDGAEQAGVTSDTAADTAADTESDSPSDTAADSASGTAADTAPAAVPGALLPARLRCEYRTEPLGVDRKNPELSWIVTSEKKGQVQSAYHVLVASTPEKLTSGQGDLWDSGKVTGNATFGIDYAGAKLRSHQACYWKVRAWDAEGQAGPWSATASWSVGILDQSEWQGAWIGYDALRKINGKPPIAALEGADWICHAADEPKKAPAAQRVYLKTWELPSDAEFKQAKLTISADDQSDVRVNGIQVISTRNHKHPKSVEVASFLRQGKNEIRVGCWNHSEGPTGICLKLVVQTAADEEFTLTSDKEWSSIAEVEDSWEEEVFENTTSVRVAGPFGCSPWGKVYVQRDISAPPSYLRGSFEVEKSVRRATVYLAALGWADLSLNGKLVNRDYFSSGWTDYKKRVYYRAYDVSDSVQKGENAWGVLLADGWYSGHIGWAMKRDNYGRNPRVRAMMHVEYDDGTSQDFSTDGSWAAHTGPTSLADILIGEEYDATAENRGWDQVGASKVDAQAVDVDAEVSPLIEWHPAPPVVEVEEFPAQKVAQPAPGVYVFDIGQNIAGVAKLKIQGEKGQRIQLRFAERLNNDGTIYTENLRLARASDYYTCRGDGVEVWQPRQTFHGFQYVELTGLKKEPSLDAITGIALSTDTPLASEFDCSDENLNRLYKNILWTQRANFIDIPTDCPQRDERLGWTGDAQVYVHTACLTVDSQTFFRKWLVDLEDAQREDGQFPKVAPVVLGQDDGGPAWSDAGVICPWEIYRAYGDKQLLEQQYPSMVRYVEFCRARSKDGVLPPPRFHCFGDWLNVNANTPTEVIYTAYYARSVDLLRRSAEVLGKDDDARKYGDLFEKIKQAFQKEYVKKNGLVQGNTQCGYVLAIGYGLVDGELREFAAERLVQNIESRGWKLSTGFIGTKDLMLVLSEIGRTDVALRLLHQPEYPGWLFSISHGATSIWERWDGWTPERGFQTPGMNSFAHYSFGAVYGWMAENLGGIRSKGPAYSQLVIEPVFDPALDYCRVKYDSIRGPILTAWKVVGDRREFQVTVPANADSRLRLRGMLIKEIYVDGQSFKESGLVGNDDVTVDGDAFANVALPSGEYRFSLPIVE